MTNDEVLKVKFDGWPLPDDYLIEVGRIATVWGALESALNMCLYKLAGFNEVDDPTPFILLAHTNVPQRLDMLGSSCEYLNSAYPSLKEYQPVLAALRSAQKLRNKYTHNSMVKNESGRIVMATGSARGTLKFATETVTLADLRRVTMAIHQAMLDLYKLVLKREIPPLWERPDGWKPEG